ncbi:MAG: serine/threonine protein kinase, partial [Dietzia sp.]|nr:serine/threonine protein kinase [Dietzia sp.]
MSEPVLQSGTAAVDSTAPTRPVLAASAVLFGVSLLLMTLSSFGAADALPVGVRTLVVCLVALTMPGLPVAALLRLPLNGVFGCVTVATSVATNILLAQLNIVTGLQHHHLTQAVVLGLSGAAAVALVRRSDGAPLRSVAPTVINVITRRKFSVAVLAAAAVLFATAVTRLNTDAAGRFGLVEILGVDYFLGLGLITLLLALEYRRAAFDPAMTAAANIALMVYVTMPVAWSTGSAPFPTAFAHRFIINWIADIGAVPEAVDARMSWAGFFSATAHLMQIAGLPDSEVFLTSASLVFSILMIYPVYAIGMALAENRRVAWFGVTGYVLFNWYQQDYFAPQAVALQFYATIVAVLLWQLRRSEVPILDGWATWRRIPGRVPGRDARWTMSVEALLLMIIAALVVSHQLTPLVAVVMLALFSVLGLTRYKLLWLASIVLFIAWFHYGAYGYWHGHLLDVLADIGGLDGNLTSAVADRITGDPVYGRMQYLRMGASMLLFFVALFSCFRLRHSKFGLIAVGLVLAPFSLVLMQSYGGEVVIRCFLYASPVMAPLAAMVVLPLLRRGRPWAGPVVAVAALFTVAVVLITNRGLNTSFEHTPPETLSISKQMQQLADPTEIAYWGQGSAFNVPLVFDVEDSCYATPVQLADCTVEKDPAYLVDTAADEM